MKNKFYPIVIFLLAAVGIAQAQIEFPAPTFVENNSSTWGTWMQDPLQPNSEKVWVIPGYNLNMVYEYSSMADLHTGTISKTYTLPFAFAGTGHVIYNGNLYFNKNGTNNLVKFNLATESVELDVPLSDAGFMSTYPYEWYGFSDLDFAVDGNNLFVMYSTDANAGKLVVSKLDPATLSVIQTWNTNSEPKNQMGDAFIIDGIVYCIDSFYQTNGTINYTYNTNTSTGTSASIPWTNGSTYMTSCTYNSTNGVLYSWNNGGLYFYNLSPTISEVTGSTLICPGTSTILTAHSSALAAEFKWFDAASGGNLLYTGGEFTTPVLTDSITYYVEVTSNGKTSLRTPVSISAPAVINSSIQANNLLCAQGAPATKNKAVTSLDYSWLATSCSGSQNLSFSINGTIIYIGEADEGSCNCAPNIKTLQITDSLALATLVNGDNTFVADFSATDYQSWAFVKVSFADGTSQSIKIFELYDSNNGQDNYLCNAYQYQGTYEATANLQLSTSATGGQIDLTVTGNLEPITYLWSNGATTQDVIVTTGGNYSVAINDACGQTKTESVSVAEPTPVVSTALVTHIASPSSPDGSVDLSVSGGTAPYSFLWNNGRTSEDINNLEAGVYSCTIRDSFGCTSHVQITVPQSTPFGFTANTQNTSCSNSSDGSISLVATGGTDPYQYSKDGGTTYQASNIFTGLTPGSYSVLVKDDLGTLTEIQNVSIIFVDTTPPTVVTKSIMVELDVNGTASILPSAIDNGSTDNCAIATYVLSNSSFDCSSVGPNIVTLTITDASGNAAVGTATVTVVDNAPPVISCPASITVNNDANTCGALVYYELPSVTENCPAKTNNLVVNGSFESGDYEGWHLSSSPSQYVTFGIGVAGQTINAGESIFDYANNAVQAVISPGLPYTPAPTDGERMGVFFQTGLATHSLFQDITLPQGSISLCLDLGYNNHYPGGFTATQFIAVELRNPADNSIYATLFKTLGNSPSFRPLSSMCFDISAFAGRQVRLQVIDASIQSFFLDVYFDNIKITGGGISAIQTAGLPSGSIFPFGKTTNSFIATDASGNSSVCSFDVIVTDNQAPTVVVQNRTIQLDNAGNASISANEINNGSSDNCGGIGSMSLSKTNFDCTNLGDNIVTLTVTDLSGNSASATAVVTVVDLIPPTAIAQNITVYLDSTGVANITPDTVSVSSDNCLIATLSLDKISFDKSNLGDNTVVLTVIDLSNNVSHDTATIKVIDNRPPIVITKNITVHLDSSGLASITVADINNGSSDNSGIATMSLSKSNFDCTNVGNNVVTLTVTDVNGNTATATSTVSVVDNIMPVLVGLPSNIILSACDTTVMWTPPTASDNCAGVTVVRTTGPAPGDLNAFVNGSNLITYRATDASGNFAESSFTVTRPAAFSSSITTNNAYLHFGTLDDQVATVMVRPIGGVAPYTVSVTMNRALSCSLIGTLLTGETWSAANATNSNNSCSASGVPISLGSVSSGNALTLTVSLMSNATIVATITDANGCVTTNDFEIGAEDDRCLDGLTIGQVRICHRAGGQCTTMCVDATAVVAHIAHGDYLGSCGGSCATPTAKDTTSTVTASAAKHSAEETGSDKIASDNDTILGTDIVVEAFPNPFKASIYVRLSNPEEKTVSMNMFDLMGKYVPLKPVNKTPEGVQVLDTERLTAGLYFLQVKIGEYSKTVKLIKE